MKKAELFADNAEYSNSKSFLTITENVKIKDLEAQCLQINFYLI